MRAYSKIALKSNKMFCFHALYIIQAKKNMLFTRGIFIIQEKKRTCYSQSDSLAI